MSNLQNTTNEQKVKPTKTAISYSDISEKLRTFFTDEKADKKTVLQDTVIPVIEEGYFPGGQYYKYGSKGNSSATDAPKPYYQDHEFFADIIGKSSCKNISTTNPKMLTPILISSYANPAYYYRNIDTYFQKEWIIKRDLNSFKEFIIEKFPNTSEDFKIIPVILCIDDIKDAVYWLLTEYKVLPEKITIFDRRIRRTEDEEIAYYEEIDNLRDYINGFYFENGFNEPCNITSTLENLEQVHL